MPDKPAPKPAKNRTAPSSLVELAGEYINPRFVARIALDAKGSVCVSLTSGERVLIPETCLSIADVVKKIRG